MFRLVATSGWSRPSFASPDLQAAAVERLGLGVPALSRYRIARLFRLAATSGWSRPSFASPDLEAAVGRAARPPRTGPASGTGPPGCSGLWPRRGGRARASPPGSSGCAGRAARPRRTGPGHRYRTARLFRLVATSGWSGPAASRGSSGCGGRAARPRRTGPGTGTGPPGCSGWRPRRGGRRPSLLLPDRQAAAVERLGLGVPALGLVQDRQVVQASRPRRGGRARASLPGS